MSRATRSKQPAQKKADTQQKKVVKNEEEDDMEEEAEEQKNSATIEYVWSTHKTMSYGLPKGLTINHKKLAGFDMDFTLIKTKSGKKFPQNENDWLLWDGSVKTKLKELYKEGFAVIIFSNQGGIGKGHTTHKAINTKMTNIANEIGIPIICAYSTEEDEFKKPNKGMWEFFLNKIKSDDKYDTKESFYCGDAAGRKGPPKDFSDTDLKFALNIGIPFFTPEQLFLGKKETIGSDFFDPKQLPTSGELFKEKGINIKSNVQEMIMLIGSAGSGKSTFVDTHLKDYVRVNRDTLKTMPKCLEAASKAINEKKNVVIDNTNPTKESRADFIALAKKGKVQVRAFYLELTKDLAFHLDNQRDTNANRTHFSKRVGKIPVHSFFKNVEPPTKAEGFDEVATVNFIAGPFRNKKDEESFFSFTK